MHRWIGEPDNRPIGLLVCRWADLPVVFSAGDIVLWRNGLLMRGNLIPSQALPRAARPTRL